MSPAPRAAFHAALLLSILAAPLAAPARAEALAAGGFAPVPRVAHDETVLVSALDDMAAGRLNAAIGLLAPLVRRTPTFHLAQLVYGDALLAKTGVIHGLGGPGMPAAKLADLRAEARVRLAHYLHPPRAGRVPASLIELSPTQRRVVLVDQSQSRLYVFRNVNGRPVLSADYYVTTGRNGPLKAREGDQRTPVGVYWITGRIGRTALPDFYGVGALPVSYPNEWDERYGRTGFGIWIHGVPSDTYSRPPRASDGCMALPNVDMRSVLASLDPRTTPVVIAEHVRWEQPDVVAERRATLRDAIAAWRRDWQSLDFARYARHYARDFRSNGKDLHAWLAHKRRVDDAKRYVRVRLSDVSMLAYPGEHDLVVVDFDQDYRSSNYAARTPKRQYWRREADGHWRIVYEGESAIRPDQLRGVPWSARATLSRLP